MTNAPSSTALSTNWTLPNTLTLARMLLAIPLVACTVIKTDWINWLALFIFASAAITDFLDGYLARKLNLISRFGQIFDPIADKLIVSTALIILMIWNAPSQYIIIPAMIIILREIFISGLREFASSATNTIAVNAIGKWKTALQLISISLLLMGNPWPPITVITFHAALVILWIAAALALYSGYQYSRQAFASDRKD